MMSQEVGPCWFESGRMRFLRVLVLVLAGVGLPAPAGAHFNMLLPERASARRGDAITFLYQWGHPFEHQLFDAPAPESLVVRAPDGRRTTPELREVALPAADRKVRGYRFGLTAERRGDYVLLLRTRPIWMPDEQEFLHDQVKVVLHVQAQRGWDAAVASAPESAGAHADLPEVLPLTRPYGLRPGMAFQGQLQLQGKPLPGVLVEVERYNPTPPKEMPPDEQITRVVKTDPNGIFTCTLPESGWWCMTGRREGGKAFRDGKAFPVIERATLWVYVAEAAAPKPSP
jgi:cobalt/nickel transport protein